ncbi:hypothetical protein ElyMa_001620000 [Elysia marginata]|uniref:SRCR domain-containing protein n=1 Tax=Elysia marginata TaxID=1093978 RepID=A0AAV4JKH1_9GAST|nr:hypothetical protein ElyMa_001620000 [Elysia marginata]
MEKSGDNVQALVHTEDYTVLKVCKWDYTQVMCQRSGSMSGAKHSGASVMTGTRMTNSCNRPEVALCTWKNVLKYVRWPEVVSNGQL